MKITDHILIVLALLLSVALVFCGLFGVAGLLQRLQLMTARHIIMPEAAPATQPAAKAIVPPSLTQNNQRLELLVDRMAEREARIFAVGAGLGLLIERLRPGATEAQRDAIVARQLKFYREYLNDKVPKDVDLQKEILKRIMEDPSPPL